MAIGVFYASCDCVGAHRWLPLIPFKFAVSAADANSMHNAMFCLMQVTLEPYERDHAMVVGVFRPPPKVKA